MIPLQTLTVRNLSPLILLLRSVHVPSSFDNNLYCKIVFPNKELYVNANGQEGDEEDYMELSRKKIDIACRCLKDVAVKFRLLSQPITSLPLSRGTKKHAKDLPRRISECYVPLLKLPVSGYFMKGVTIIRFRKNDLLDDDIDSFMKIDLNDFEDKEEVAYSEVVIEIVKKHRSRIVRHT
ncbi:hypothetical protein Tco_0511922 [Tanacetum coccineum]